MFSWKRKPIWGTLELYMWIILFFCSSIMFFLFLSSGQRACSYLMVLNREILVKIEKLLNLKFDLFLCCVFLPVTNIYAKKRNTGRQKTIQISNFAMAAKESLRPHYETAANLVEKIILKTKKSFSISSERRKTKFCLQNNVLKFSKLSKLS